MSSGWQRLAAREAAAVERYRRRLEQIDDPELAALLRYFARRAAARLEVAAFEPASEAPAAVSPYEGAADDAKLFWLSENLVILRLPRPPGLSYRAGDSARVRVGAVARRYSFASAPRDDELEFFIELHPGGQMAGALRSTPLPPVSVSRIKPGLRLQPRVRNHVMVATVTGISPYVSLLREHGIATGQRAIVLHGASYRDELGYAEFLSEQAAANPSAFYYIPTVSRPQEPRNSGWDGATGRVETLIDPILRRFDCGPEDTAIYACGRPEMVSKVEQAYLRLGYFVATEPY